MKDPDHRIYCLRKVYNKLPPANKAILKKLFSLLHVIHNNQLVNKMSAANLSIVFAPTFFRRRIETAESLLDDQNEKNIITTMITNYLQLFTVRLKNSYHQLMFVQPHTEPTRRSTTNTNEFLATLEKGASLLEMSLQMEAQQLEIKQRNDFPQLESIDNSNSHIITNTSNGKLFPVPNESTNKNHNNNGLPVSTTSIDQIGTSTSQQFIPASNPNSVGAAVSKKQMPREMWYYEDINRADAEKLLISCKANVFLVRNSSMFGKFALSKFNFKERTMLHQLITPISTYEGTYYFIEESTDKNIYKTVDDLISNTPECFAFDAIGTKTLQRSSNNVDIHYHNIK